MRKRTLLFASLIIAAQTGTVWAQGAFLEKGESGCGVEAGVSTDKDSFGYGGSFGYSIAGYFDLSGSVTEASVKSDSPLEYIGYTNHLNVTSFDIGGTAYVSREDSTSQPFDIALSMDYGRDNYSSPAFSSQGANISGEDFTFGGTLFRNIDLSSMEYIQPSVTVAYLISSITGEQRGYEAGTSENILVYSAGFSYAIGSRTSTEYLISPAVVINKHDVTFSLTAGVIFPTSR